MSEDLSGIANRLRSSLKAGDVDGMLKVFFERVDENKVQAILDLFINDDNARVLGTTCVALGMILKNSPEPMRELNHGIARALVEIAMNHPDFQVDTVQ